MGTYLGSLHPLAAWRLTGLVSTTSWSPLPSLPLSRCCAARARGLLVEPTYLGFPLGSLMEYWTTLPSRTRPLDSPGWVPMRSDCPGYYRNRSGHRHQNPGILLPSCPRKLECGHYINSFPVAVN